MKERIFTFNKFFQKIYDKGYQPTCFLTVEDQFKERLIRGGYLVQKIEKKEVLIATCALANISKTEREKAQKHIDKMPMETFTIKQPLRRD